MSVRLYHDAMVAEVCSSQQIFRFKARYDYPNKKLHQRDEKHQINQFLADWLRFVWRMERWRFRFVSGVKPKDTIWKAY